MGKYNYDRSVLKGLSVSAFLNETKEREKHIQAGRAEMPRSQYNPNVLADKLHPSYQCGVIKKIIETRDAKTFIIEPDSSCGFTSLAYFRAGQYVSVAMDFDGARVCRPYSIASAPADALNPNGSSYEITVKRKENGFASDYILSEWKAGSKLIFSGPLGNFYYQGLRDAKTVIACAGGSGITPFLSMARAIAAGEEDFNLVILYGSRTYDSILLKEELEHAQNASGGKVKVVHVLSDEEKEGCEHGFITAELIKKYASGDYSLFACGPQAMYTFLEGEARKLGLPKRRVRFELSGEHGDPTGDEAYPKEAAGKEFCVKVWIRGESKEITCRAEETLLNAMEHAGISVPSDCRSGQCGWCHSRLISGETYIPASCDGRRAADKKFGWIHPCSAYPLSDIELEIFPIM